jgi:hypothetical protein
MQIHRKAYQPDDRIKKRTIDCACSMPHAMLAHGQVNDGRPAKALMRTV